MEFDALASVKALATLPPEPPKIAEPKGNAWTAVPRALAAAVAETSALAVRIGTAAPPGSNASGGQTEQMGKEFSRSLRNVAEDYAPDPQTASKAESIIFGLTRGVTKAVGYGLTTGPAAPFLFGADEGVTQMDALQRKGVDDATAAKVGAVAGVVNAAGFLIPAAGSTVAKTFGLATLSGPASFVAQQAASREILARADYSEQAETFDPADPWGLALSALPYGFGAWAMRSRVKVAPVKPQAEVQARPVDAPTDGRERTLTDADGRERTPAPAAPALTREHVDAAMVQNLTHAADHTATFASPRSESLAEFAARTLPPEPKAPTGPDPFLGWLKQNGGVSFAEKFDITGERGGIAANRGGVFAKGGRGLDDLAQIAEAEGWLPPGAAQDVDGGVQALRDMIGRSMAGERVLPMAEQWAKQQADAAAQQRTAAAEPLAKRLRALGVDPEPARMDPDVLQAYLDQHEPRLLAAALGDVADDAPKVVPDVPPPTRDATPQTASARQAAQDMADSGKTLDQFLNDSDNLPGDVRNLLIGMSDAGMTPERQARMLADFERTAAAQPLRSAVNVSADVVEASRAGREVTPAPQAQAQTAGELKAVEMARARADQVVREAPDLVVGMTEDGDPITAAQALAAIRREAEEGTADTLGSKDAPLVDVAVQCALSLGQ